MMPCMAPSPMWTLQFPSQSLFTTLTTCKCCKSAEDIQGRSLAMPKSSSNPGSRGAWSRHSSSLEWIRERRRQTVAGKRACTFFRTWLAKKAVQVLRGTRQRKGLGSHLCNKRISTWGFWSRGSRYKILWIRKNHCHKVIRKRMLVH